MAGETPTPSFTPVDRTKSTGREGFKNPFSQEQRQARADRKAERLVQKRQERAARKKYSQSEMQQKRQERNQKGKYLNMTEHPSFARHRAELRAAALAGGNLQNEVLGNRRGELTPSQLAQIDAQAYELFKKDHPDLIQDCRANDLYFTPPDKDGNQKIDFRRDPWMSAVDAQAYANPENAAQIYAQFCAECPDKAKVYALLGHKELAKQVADMKARGPDSSAAVTGQTNVPESAPVTVNLAEQKQKDDLAKYGVLSAKEAKDPASMSFAEKNEMRQLKKDYEQQITAAQTLADEFDKDPTKILTPAELDMLEKYKNFLKTPEVTPAAGTAPTADALQAQNEKQKRDLGNEAIGKLKERGIDVSKMTQQEALDALKGRKITNPDGKPWEDDQQTQDYIRGAYAEQQKQQAEAAVDKLPAETTDALVKKGMTKNDILELILGLIAAGVVSVGQDALTRTATSAAA